ncbi:hypothetical protein DFR75_1051 [Nocardia ignorata]|uniref:Uncharacterized protein n=1 Tax=Nocardia ignorata TaxID=145285 RepID=A0A4R6P4K5_NOCIG|nr:hypothetical protein DFR75_1051 [Nocardia ignorata]
MPRSVALPGSSVPATHGGGLPLSALLRISTLPRESRQRDSPHHMATAREDLDCDELIHSKQPMQSWNLIACSPNSVRKVHDWAERVSKLPTTSNNAMCASLITSQRLRLFLAELVSIACRTSSSADTAVRSPLATAAGPGAVSANLTSLSRGAAVRGRDPAELVAQASAASTASAPASERSRQACVLLQQAGSPSADRFDDGHRRTRYFPSPRAP